MANLLYDTFFAPQAGRDRAFLILPDGSEISGDAFLRMVHRVAHALMACGVQPGDRIAVQIEKSPMALAIYGGAVAAGAIFLPLNTAYTAAEIDYFVGNATPRLLLADGRKAAALEPVAEAHGARLMVVNADGSGTFADLVATQGDDFTPVDRGADDLAAFLYTSGTTGQPKGAMISHGNILATMEGGLRALPTNAASEQLCFLPLCHILERDSSIYFPLAVGSTVNFAESPETVFDNLREVSPHVFTAVPRVWEKIYSRVTVLASEATTLGRWAFKLALGVGMARATALQEGRAPGVLVSVGFWLADWAVFSNLRRMLGMDRLQQGTTGAAPISPALLTWFRAIGVPLYEGYGMTENAGLATVNTPGANLPGSVGRAIPGVQVRIAEDGEIQTLGHNNFVGYWQKPDKTAETYTADGWLRTGDMGRIDDGFVVITGRIKDIIITAGGKNITPAEIESRLKFSPYISDAVVIGDKRKFLTCLVMIDQENVEKFAQDHKVPFSDFASLCRAQAVQDLIGAEVAQVNREFARVEQIKDFRLIDVLLTAEAEELTSTIKLRRSFVEKRHKALIDDMFR
jgi:long-chain acyl-CoA synthetase